MIYKNNIYYDLIYTTPTVVNLRPSIYFLSSVKFSLCISSISVLCFSNSFLCVS